MLDLLNKMPFKDRKAISERLEKWASQALTPEERAQYEEEWKIYNDYFNTLDFAEKTGIIATARKLKKMGMTNDFIIEATGLSKEEIDNL